jgi:isochorismate hydrolase
VVVVAWPGTVAELNVDATEGARVFDKLKFSMLTDEVRQVLERDHPERKDVVLLGIEAHVCVLQTVLVRGSCQTSCVVVSLALADLSTRVCVLCGIRT